MTDAPIPVTVTPDPSALSGFSWQFPTPLATCDPGSNSIEIILVAGQSGDTCVFQTGLGGQQPPLTFFTNWTLTETFTPVWFQNPQISTPSTFTFTDDNMNVKDRTYHLVINAVYTDNSVNPPVSTPITSPDPTIVNAGTDGNVHVGDVAKGLTASQSPVEPAAVAV
ncbi:MAG: hypothetical protein ACJ76Y_12760 [Thermoanaerobaculia bacterium]